MSELVSTLDACHTVQAIEPFWLAENDSIMDVEE